jgi:hypothetical protein
MRWRTFLFALTVGTFCICCGARLPGTGVSADSGKQSAKAARHETRGQIVAMPAGTVLRVRIDDALSTARNSVGDPFTGTLVDPVVIDGEEVLPALTRFKGQVTASEKSSRSQGRAIIGITLNCYELRGSQHPVMTSLDTLTRDGFKNQNIELVDGRAGSGASIGAKGASGAPATRTRGVTIAADTVFSFVLKVPVPL